MYGITEQVTETSDPQSFDSDTRFTSNGQNHLFQNDLVLVRVSK